MKNYYMMLHDEKLCIGCQACTVACANRNDIDNDHDHARVQVQIYSTATERYRFKRISCQHCEHSPCVKVCPTGASYVDNDGIVRVKKDLCIACEACMIVCPYKVRYIDPRTKSADKCDFCAESRLAEGKLPACVSVCPTSALKFVKSQSAEGKVWLSSKENVIQDTDKKAGKAHLLRHKEIHERG